MASGRVPKIRRIFFMGLALIPLVGRFGVLSQGEPAAHIVEKEARKSADLFIGTQLRLV